MLRRRPRLWAVWSLLVLAVSFPWVGFTTDPQWHRVHLIPLTDPADRIRDMAANILLFVPFGYSAGKRRPALHAVVKAVGLAMAVSVIAEASQLFSTRRFPSATDVAAAALGALLGSFTTLWRRPPSKPGKWTDSSRT